MLQRYLGNKTSLTGEIVRLVSELCPLGSHVCDAFAGSLAVSVALRRSGYRVSSNDINLLSWVYGVTYLANTGLPEINFADLIGSGKVRRDLAQQTRLDMGTEPPYDPDLCVDHSLVQDWKILIATMFSNYGYREISTKDIRTDFFDHYCEAGPKSAFTSSRGSSGRRRFLSTENAIALDRAMTRLRVWFRTGRISNRARCLLTSCLLDAVERVSNIQGTYHDFPRNFYDPRALKPISAILPELKDIVTGPAAEVIGKGRDSLDFVGEIPAHSVLYLDPPYNFRQYTAYYFLPNLIAAYPEIEDLDSYFSNIKYVRGQNMESDFSSTFCSATGFLPSLERLIRNADCEHVILSYFNGKNHWHDFKSGTDDQGRERLEAFFSGDLFESDSVQFFPVDRLNYQSYGGHKALQLTEYLFVAKKKRNIEHKNGKEESTYAVV
ncbi:DNA adenine methylase [Burkholderia sp. BCC1985]|uniref:DNA adenine methylase n=1 Tax=Burkholderia sp. BCC1985 TaxID=2817442 RepID=UPI002AB06224|nr:DNA adenine methylase [Burkholderia sp. BCC1985]